MCLHTHTHTHTHIYIYIYIYAPRHMFSPLQFVIHIASFRETLYERYALRTFRAIHFYFL